MKVKITSNTPNPEYNIVMAARQCYNSESKGDSVTFDDGTIVLGEKDKTLLKSLVKRQHLSVLEHSSVTFSIKGISRTCSHQLVRHRIASYSQKSQRYVSESRFNFSTPDSILDNKDALDAFNCAMEDLQLTYNRLSEYGIPKEDARFVLPNACSTDIVVSMNFRALREFLEKRLIKQAQWEIRRLASKMLKEVMKIAPNVFEDLIDV